MASLITAPGDVVGREPMRVVCLVAVMLAVGLWLSAADPAAALTGREVLDKAKLLDDTTRKWTDRVQTMKLTIHGKGGGTRVRELRVFDKEYEGGEDKSISFFQSPPEVKGTGFLQWSHKGRDDDQWLYLPEFKRTRRITARIRDQSFMGTDFSYRDLEILGEIQDWTEEEAPTKLVGDEDVEHRACHVIELHPRQEGMSYSKIVLWMDKDMLVARRMHFYDRDDRHLKTLTLTDIRDVGPIPTAHRLEMRNLKKGSYTVVDLRDVSYDTGAEDSLFTQRYLERGVP